LVGVSALSFLEHFEWLCSKKSIWPIKTTEEEDTWKTAKKENSWVSYIFVEHWNKQVTFI